MIIGNNFPSGSGSKVTVDGIKQKDKMELYRCGFNPLDCLSVIPSVRSNGWYKIPNSNKTIKINIGTDEDEIQLYQPNTETIVKKITKIYEEDEEGQLFFTKNGIYLLLFVRKAKNSEQVSIKKIDINNNEITIDKKTLTLTIKTDNIFSIKDLIIVNEEDGDKLYLIGNRPNNGNIQSGYLFSCSLNELPKTAVGLAEFKEINLANPWGNYYSVDFTAKILKANDNNLYFFFETIYSNQKKILYKNNNFVQEYALNEETVAKIKKAYFYNNFSYTYQIEDNFKIHKYKFKISTTDIFKIEVEFELVDTTSFYYQTIPAEETKTNQDE